ncbi:hypothetical protein ACMD2_17899 [Ananas comosus]|nr:hypothetical protein ACMD2_17899 [Ananas comosus]
MAAAAYIRPKRASAPLDAAARARLRGDEVAMGGYDSSGSEHAALSGLIHAFFESEAGGGDAVDGAAAASVAAATAVEDSDGGEESDAEDGDRAVKTAEEVRALLGAAGKGDSFRIRLTADVSAAVEALAAFQRSRSAFCRAVMARLRECGYNAGLCKARWDGSKGIAAGNYEYIDVVAAATADDGVGGRRYIIDVGFAAEFELARATEEYGRVAGALPAVAVARPEEVRRAVKAVAKAARRSLQSRGLSVPPWRKRRFMAAKWLGPYRRTTNPLPASAGAAAVAVAAAGGGDVVCRAVGFAAPLPQPERPCYYYY